MDQPSSQAMAPSLRRHVADRLAFLLQAERRAVPGLADHHAVLEQARLGVVGAVPELLDPGLVLDREGQDLVIDLLEGILVLEGVGHPVRRQLAGSVHPQPDAQKQRVRTALNLALVLLLPQRAIGQRLVLQRR